MRDQTPLMRRIHADLGALLATITRDSPIPAAFLAALVANESNGKPGATRFEKNVFMKLSRACLGVKDFTDPSLLRHIPQSEWLKACDIALARRQPGESFFGAGLQELRVLSTSFGYTQIMGWHSVPWAFPLSDLLHPELHFIHARKIAEWNVDRYGLNPEKDFGKMFRFWNTGYPYGRTYHTQYVPWGLARIKVYNKVLQEVNQ